MENITLNDVSNWKREGDKLYHKFINLTDNQINIIKNFVWKHHNYYICTQGRNTITLCKETI